MLPLEIKQSGGKLLPHSDLREGVFLGEASRRIQKPVLVTKIYTCKLLDPKNDGPD